MEERIKMRIALIALALLSGCSAKDAVFVSEKDYGANWPLVVSEAEVGCRDGKIAYVKTVGRPGADVYFALNGNAIRAGLPSVDAIKKPMYANTVMVADFTEKAMKLCR